MKYAVIGLGAVGSIVGGLLTKSGENVVLIGKKNQVDVINKNGIKLNGINGSFIVSNANASSDLLSLKDIDLIIICVKSQDTQNLAYSLKDNIKKSAIILTLQNGVRNSDIFNKITGNKVISGVVLFNALYSTPGEATLTIKGGLLIEDYSLYHEAIQGLINSFKNEGLNSKSSKNIKGFQWSKLIVNLQNAITALTGQTIKESIIDPYSRSILIATMKEGMYILEKSGISIKTLPDMDPKKIINRLSRYNTIILKIGSKLLRLKNARTSMWQSLSRGKNTEIDFINGEIVNLANENNFAAPINTKLVRLIKVVEASHSKRFYKPSELMDILNIKI
jgi:2-dehydropantoate 2-reductase